MNKNIVSELGSRLGRDKKSTQILLDALQQALIQSIGQQQQVAMPGFGTFEAIKQEEQIVKDLSTGQRMLLPPEITLIFTPASKLRKIAKQNDYTE